LHYLRLARIRRMLLDRRIYREPSIAGTVTYGARMSTSVTAGLEEGGGSKGGTAVMFRSGVRQGLLSFSCILEMEN
jgi:hypothetical protein